jgi:predicted alpha/beta superfamily hydrolase
MHDGQNLFNEQTAPNGEWGVDEAIDSLQQKTGRSCIVVGIDHGGDKRMTEYNPYNSQFGKGEGAQYVQFIVETLKPFIDKKYRTLKDSTNTFIAGSSMGGLISLYAINKYPNIFGSAGVFSPAFWIAPDAYTDLQEAKLRGIRRFYFYAGGKESNTMVPDMDKMIRIIESKKGYETMRVLNPIAKHNEAAWRKEFADFYRWLMRVN